MIVVGCVLAGIAAAVHVYIFVLESLVWTGARARATFGTTPDEAATTRALAFNQGFYNLFLAVTIAVGLAVMATGRTAVGATLVLTGAGSMVAAGLVLLISSPTRARAALVQLGPPLLGVVVLVAGLAS